MSIGLLFWILMILAVIFNWPVASPTPAPPNSYRPVVGRGLILVLFFLLGWAEFGFVLHR